MSKREKYLASLPSVSDENGFIQHDEHDSLLFTGLAGCVAGINPNIMAAFNPAQGTWHRRPLVNNVDTSYPEHSKSSISRDMLLGLAYYAYYNSRLDISDQVIRYALSNMMVMGKGVKSRTVMSPALLSTFAWISYALGGASRAWLRWIPLATSKNVKDFQAHLQVLHCALRNTLGDKTDYRPVFKYHADRQDKNPLFQFLNGNKGAARLILEDPLLWPENRLPTTWERKEPWLFQRDKGPDWAPDFVNPAKVHSGCDYLFLDAWMTGRLKK